MDLDDVLHHAGDWGKYQHLLLWLVCLPACIPCGFAAFNQVFMDRIPDAWCKIPELMSGEWSAENRKAVSIPKSVIVKNSCIFPQVDLIPVMEWILIILSNKGSTYSQCLKYDVNYTDIIWENDDLSNMTRNESIVTFCTDGWEYDVEKVSSSIIIDVGLKISGFSLFSRLIRLFL